MRWFALGMSVLYIAGGTLFLLTDFALDLIPRYRTGLAAVLIGYGALRIWMWIRKQRATTSGQQP